MLGVPKAAVPSFRTRTTKAGCRTSRPRIEIANWYTAPIKYNGTKNARYEGCDGSGLNSFTTIPVPARARLRARRVLQRYLTGKSSQRVLTTAFRIEDLTLPVNDAITET